MHRIKELEDRYAHWKEEEQQRQVVIQLKKLFLPKMFSLQGPVVRSPFSLNGG